MYIYHAQHWILNIFFSPTSLHFLIPQTLNLPQCADLTVLDGVGLLLLGLQGAFVLTGHQQLWFEKRKALENTKIKIKYRVKRF